MYQDQLYDYHYSCNPLTLQVLKNFAVIEIPANIKLCKTTYLIGNMPLKTRDASHSQKKY